VYRALLRLYPASFRAEYGEEMCAIFARRRRDATGLLPTLLLWLEALADVAGNALRVHGDILRQDLAFTARTLSTSRGFALTAVVVSALGIGATTAAFSITDHVLFRPLPFAEPDRLVRLWQAQGGYGHTQLSPANYRDWKRMSRSFEEMGAFGGQAYNLGGDGEPERVEGQWVTAEVFRVLGVRPVVGRVFGGEDAAPGAPAAVVLGYALWQSRFGGETSVVGRSVLVDGAPHVVIGVMPGSFHFPNRGAELWMSMPSRGSRRTFPSIRHAPRCGWSPRSWSRRSRTRTRARARRWRVCATGSRPKPAFCPSPCSRRRLASC
jgi:putative ABC transport system permease protein